MGWTYDSAHLEIPLNQVRFLIGDTVQDDPLVETDDEIAFCLAQKGNDIYLAGAFACRRAATRLTRELSVVGKAVAVVLDIEKAVDELTKKAGELEQESIKQGGASIYLGGISQADVDAREDNTNNVVPGFTADKHTQGIKPSNDPRPEDFWHDW